MTVPLHAGEYVLGVRVNSDAVGVLLRELFADRVVAGAEPPGNLSLLLAPEVDDGPQDLHRLYITYARALRSRSARRTLEALWHELDVRDVEVAGERMQVDATVVVRDGRAFLLPANVRRDLVDDQRRWQADGFTLVDRRRVDLDPVAGTITIPTPRLCLPDQEVSERLAVLNVPDRPEPVQPTGTLPIGAWVLPPADRTLAGRVVDAAGQVVDRSAHGGVAMVSGLAELLAGSPDLVWTRPQDVRAKLAA